MTVFNDLENALSPFVGGNDAAGAVLGFSVVVVFIVGIVIALGKEVLKGLSGLLLVLLITSFVSLPGVDWWPIWIPLLMGLAILLYKFNPFD